MRLSLCQFKDVNWVTTAEVFYNNSIKMIAVFSHFTLLRMMGKYYSDKCLPFSNRHKHFGSFFYVLTEKWLFSGFQKPQKRELYAHILIHHYKVIFSLSSFVNQKITMRIYWVEK